MVKGAAKRAVIVRPADTQHFEQAIFILKDNAVGEGVTDEALLKEAQKAIHTGDRTKKRLLCPRPEAPADQNASGLCRRHGRSRWSVAHQCSVFLKNGNNGWF